MNLPKVTETLQEHGISHAMIAPHVMQIHWLVDRQQSAGSGIRRQTQFYAVYRTVPADDRQG